MAIKLTTNQIKRFPIHDAELYLFTISRNINGDLLATIHLKVIDDSYDPGYSYPIENEITRVSLQKCFVVITDIKGSWTGQDTFDDLNVIENSELLKKAHKTALNASELQHFRFTLHSGSQLDIVADSIILE